MSIAKKLHKIFFLNIHRGEPFSKLSIANASALDMVGFDCDFGASAVNTGLLSSIFVDETLEESEEGKCWRPWKEDGNPTFKNISQGFGTGEGESRTLELKL